MNFIENRKNRLSSSLEKTWDEAVEEELEISGLMSEMIEDGMGIWAAPDAVELVDQKPYILQIEPHILELAIWEESQNMFLVQGYEPKFVELKEIHKIYQ